VDSQPTERSPRLSPKINFTHTGRLLMAHSVTMYPASTVGSDDGDGASRACLLIDFVAGHPAGSTAGSAPGTFACVAAVACARARFAILSPRIGKTSVERTAAPTRAAAVEGRMWPLVVAKVVIATTSGSCVELRSASARRSP
jgi:hypothetical protein